MPTSRGWLVADVSLKTAMVVLLVVALAWSDVERFSDKAMGARAVAYPLLVGAVPLGWLLWWHRRGRPYPADVAALVTLPFVVDLLGNAADLFDTVGWFDDAAHFVNWAVLASALAVALRGQPLPAWVVTLLCAGCGALTAIVWEIGEYGAFVLDTPESVTAYRDTLGDLTLGTSGATLVGIAAAVLRRSRAATANKR